MLNSKQRAYLRSLANTMKPITQIGKDGVNERFLEQLDNMLDSRELVKVNILETAGLDAKETAKRNPSLSLRSIRKERKQQEKKIFSYKGIQG